MNADDLQVEIVDGEISVTRAATNDTITYRKSADLPHLELAHSWIAFGVTTPEISEFRTQAFQASAVCSAATAVTNSVRRTFPILTWTSPIWDSLSWADSRAYCRSISGAYTAAGEARGRSQMDQRRNAE
jgi:hypothetical protein